MRCHTQIDSPIGQLALVAEDDKLVGLYTNEYCDRSTRYISCEASPLFSKVKEELDLYFKGELREFTVPITIEGSDFQKQVYAELLKIPFGETISYGELARRVGNTKASRAVGLANGKNPLSIVVPCHRVIGANGALTGYGGGLERKEFLLQLERSLPVATEQEIR